MFFGKILSGLTAKKLDFEDELHCVAVCNFHDGIREIGALLLKRGDIFEIKFAFQIEGLHPFQSEIQIANILQSWNDGIISLREGLRIHHINTSERKVLSELEQRAESIKNPTLKYLSYCRAKAAADKTANNLRCQHSNLIFTSHKYVPHRTGNDNFLEDKLSWLIDKYKTLNQEKEGENKTFFEHFFNQSFHQGYLAWEQLLNQRFRFRHLNQLSSNEIWQYIWYQFNDTPIPKIPYLIDVYIGDKNVDISEKMSGNRCLSSCILGGGGIKPSIPYRSPQWNHWIYVKNKYVGAIVWEKQIEGFNDTTQFNFFWQRIKDIPNSEIVFEIHPANQKIEEFLMRRAVKGNNFDIEQTQKANDINVRALRNNREIIQAQEKMLENRKICRVSAVIFLYRDSLEQLNRDIDKAGKLFPPGTFLRELDEVDRLWLNKLPIVLEELVRKERLIKTLSDEIPLPVVCPQSFDSEGFELTTLDGYKPIYIDFKNQHRGMLTIARTSRGKTTLAIDTVDHNLGDGIKSVCIDYGNVDGTTTYTDYNRGLGKRGVSLQAGIDEYNLIQTPNLSGLAPKLQEKRSVVTQGFVLNFLLTIILGEDRTSKVAKRVSALLSYIIPKFYDSQEIKARFAAGHRGGLGSSDWLKMPTAIDLRNYVKVASDQDFEGSEIFQEAKEEVLWGLNTFIHSRLGQKLSVPSKIDIEADFLCISMREARDDNEMALLSLCAQSLAINQALKHPKCYVLLDEGNIIAKNKAVLRSVAEFVVNGRKGGIFCNVIMQNVDTLMAAGDLGQAIIDNLPVKMIGSVEESAISNLAKSLKLPETVFEDNAGDRFLPDNTNLASRWLMVAEGLKIQVNHNPSPELMALVASDPPESRARKRYLEAYPHNFLKAISLFTPDYQQARQGNKKFSELNPQKSSSDIIVH